MKVTKKIGYKNRTIIPKQFLDELGITQQSNVDMYVEDNKIIIVKSEEQPEEVLDEPVIEISCLDKEEVIRIPSTQERKKEKYIDRENVAQCNQCKNPMWEMSKIKINGHHVCKECIDNLKLDLKFDIYSSQKRKGLDVDFKTWCNN